VWQGLDLTTTSLTIIAITDSAQYRSAKRFDFDHSASASRDSFVHCHFLVRRGADCFREETTFAKIKSLSFTLPASLRMATGHEPFAVHRLPLRLPTAMSALGQ
jgi:hypothetical protein